MGVFRLNHAVLFVRDLRESRRFYVDLLGFEEVEMGAGRPQGALFLRAPGSTNDHDLGLFALGPAAGPSAAGRSTVGLYHLAWEVDSLADLEELGRRLQAAGSLVGASDHGTTKSLYARDPDGLELEVVWIVPAALLDDDARRAQGGVRPLDLAAEIARFGARTPGGIGISRPAGV